MKILLIGYSQIARKRIIPALIASGQVQQIDIATKSSVEAVKKEQKIPGKIFDSYDDALQQSDADIVYISLINSLHSVWAEKALKKGLHVIVDKPACLAFTDAERMTELAKKNRVLLAEAIVFYYHPQIKMAIDEFKKNNTFPAKVSAVFSFPPFKDNNFRYRKEFGGGSLFDLGPYAVSAGSVFFGEYPEKTCCFINSRASSGVDISFSIAASYKSGRSMVGHFGFDTEYQNTITVLGKSLCVHFDRVFTIPPDYSNSLNIKILDKAISVSVPPSDCFVNFFSAFFKACNNGRFESFYENLLSQSEALDKLIKSSEQGNSL